MSSSASFSGAGRLSEVARARAALAGIGAGNPGLEADLLMAEATGLSRVALYTAHDRALAPDEQHRFDAMLARRLARTPLQHVLGHAEFYGLELIVPEGVFVPRPDTETLVEAALAHLEAAALFAEVGTGSGAVALALLSRRPGARAMATDVSALAVETARRNAAALGLAERIRIEEGDLLAPFEPLEGCLDAVISNPPYVRDADLPTLPPEVLEHEPRTALAGGPDGLEVVRRLAAGAEKWLRSKGVLAFEIGYDQREVAVAAIEARPGLMPAGIWDDLEGRPRIVVAVKR